MSSPEEIAEVCRWLRFACEDLAAAEALLHDEDFVPRHVCWLAQQAAEKALKAALVFLSREFPFRHDLDALRNLLPRGWRIKDEQPDLAELTEWAVEARYPGDWPDATLEAAQRAARQSRAVYDGIVAELEERGVSCGAGGKP